MIHEGVTVLVDLSWDRVRSRRFPAGELLHGLDGFGERGREAELGVGLYLRQTGDGDFGDGEGAAEDAPEVFCPSLKTFCLLGELGTAGGPEKSCSPLGWPNVDNLDRGEVVRLFVEVRLPFDLLGLASRPGVLHLPQPLLHKEATTAEGCFVVVGGAIDVYFLQAVLLGELVADVIGIESVMVLAAFATEYGQSRRLDCVPQLTPSVLHGGVLVSVGNSDWNVG
ncbi:hypothetical protein SprV_0100420800 [Sparganum proliferum]